MPIISRIGRRSWKVRALIGVIYLLLLTGAVTMVYPFLLMISGSTKSAVDTPDPKVIPPFLVNERALYQKYVEGLFNEAIDLMRFVYRVEAPSFAQGELPPPPRRAFVEVWTEFLSQTPLPEYAYAVGFTKVVQSRGVIPHQLRAFKRQLAREYQGDLTRLNAELGSEFASWAAFAVEPESVMSPHERMGLTPLQARYREFAARQPVSSRCYVSVEGYYKSQVLQNRYGRDIRAYNESHGTAYSDWGAVFLDRTVPTGPGRTEAERDDWVEFTRSLVNSVWVRAAEAAAPAYRDFLRAKYRDIATLNRQYATAYGSFDDVPLVQEPPMSGLVRSDWEAFLRGWKDPDTGELHAAAAEHLRIHSVEFLFRDHLQQRFGTLEALNAAVGTSYTDWRQVLPPQQDLHYLAFRDQQGWLRWEFVTRNYRSVFDYIALHGRALVNTAIYCGLLIACSLLVNPCAAYALSRYRPPSAYKILLFLMLTMAFPPMVTQIPVFLTLRDLNLLNTFAALILPGIANGYSIFLLKGFFDSLPRELYESAELDGASEFRIFWQLTMSLSKPILAVIALNAFTSAYSNFMFALLICQDKEMWTLMPWLYQLQQVSSQGVIFASLLIASVPTLILFIFCQKIIMRGIVVPVEK